MSAPPNAPPPRREKDTPHKQRTPPQQAEAVCSPEWRSTKVIHDQTAAGPWSVVLMNFDALDMPSTRAVQAVFSHADVRVHNVPGSLWKGLSSDGDSKAKLAAVVSIVSRIESSLDAPGILVCIEPSGIRLGFRYAIHNPSHIAAFVAIDPDPRVLPGLTQLVSETLLSIRPRRPCFMVSIVTQPTDRAALALPQGELCNKIGWQSVMFDAPPGASTPFKRLLAALPSVHQKIIATTQDGGFPSNPKKRARDAPPPLAAKEEEEEAEQKEEAKEAKPEAPEYTGPSISSVHDVTPQVLWHAMRVPVVRGYDIVSAIAAILPESMTKEVEIELAFGTLVPASPVRSTPPRASSPISTPRSGVRQSPNIRAGPISSSGGLSVSRTPKASGSAVLTTGSPSASSGAPASDRFVSGCCHAVAIGRKETFFRPGLPQPFMFDLLCERLSAACDAMRSPDLVYKREPQVTYDQIFDVPAAELAASFPGVFSSNAQGAVELRIERSQDLPGPKGGVAIFKQKPSQLDVSCSGVQSAVMDWRLRVSREIPLDLSKIASTHQAQVKRIRYKKRHSFVMGSWSFDLTEVTTEIPGKGGSFGSSRTTAQTHGTMEPTTYEFEIEYVELTRKGSLVPPGDRVHVDRMVLANSIAAFAKFGAVLAAWTGSVT